MKIKIISAIILSGLLTGTISCGNQASEQQDANDSVVTPMGPDTFSQFSERFANLLQSTVPGVGDFLTGNTGLGESAIQKLQLRLQRQSKSLGRTFTNVEAQEVGDAVRALLADFNNNKFTSADLFAVPLQNNQLKNDLVVIVDRLYPPNTPINPVNKGILTGDKNARSIAQALSVLGSPSSDPSSRSLASSALALYGTQLDPKNPNGQLKKALGLSN